MTRIRTSGHFIDGARGPIFVLARGHDDGVGGCVLVVPPFAEEMNKCRRMVTEVALGLASRGTATVVPDLYGTGDSAGDFSDATWEAWRGDLVSTARWTARRGRPVTGILAIRLGCALAAEVVGACENPQVTRTVLWQPVFDGARFLGQFLRLRTAASLMGGQNETVSGLRERLKAGETLEVAGYGLSPELATGLEAVTPPRTLPHALAQVAWLEALRGEGAGLPEHSLRLVDATRAQGMQVQTEVVPGEPFWTSTEVVVIPELVAVTIDRLLGGGDVRQEHCGV